MAIVRLTWLLMLAHCTCTGSCTGVSGEKDGLSQGGLPGVSGDGANASEQEPVTRSPPRSLAMATASSPAPLATSRPGRSGRERGTTGARAPAPRPSPGPSPGGEATPDGLAPAERAFRIAQLRSQLLQQLDLTGLPPPSNKSSRSLPPVIKKRILGQPPPRRDPPRYERPSSEITQVVSYADNYTKDCPGLGFCFRFRLVRDVLGKHVKSAHLWIFLTSTDETNRSPVRRFTFWLLLSGDLGLRRKELATKVMSKREGWFRLELPKEGNDWSSLEYRIQLTSAGADSPGNPARLPAVSLAADELPVLTVALDADAAPRGRRARRQACAANSATCCLHPFRVDLTEVLQGVVVFPDSVFANFCRGNCVAVANFETVHAKMMRDRSQSEPDDDLREDLEPCCVPASYANPQSMIVRHSDGTLLRREVRDVSALTCGCK